MIADLIAGILYVAVCQTIEQEHAHRQVARQRHKRFDRTLLLAAKAVRSEIGQFGALVFQ